jgi:hypothetical protein
MLAARHARRLIEHCAVRPWLLREGNMLQHLTTNDLRDLRSVLARWIGRLN